MNLKYNRLDMKNRALEGNYSMKLRSKPSTTTTPLLPPTHIKKNRQKKTKRNFGTDLTNQPEATPIPIQPQLNQTSDPLSEIQPYLCSIESHIDKMDSAYLNTIQQQLLQNANQQISITEGMRRVLVRWLMQVGVKFQVKNQTIHICTQIIDYVLLFDNNKITRDNFQLLGVTAMFVASKYNEIHTYEAAKYVFVCDGLYNIDQLFEMEGLILSVTKFNLQFPTIHQYIGVIIEKTTSQEMLNNILLLTDLSMLDFTLFNRYKKRHVAAVILYLALKLQNPTKVKSRVIIEKTNMQESTFKECLEILLKLYRQRQRGFNK